MPVSMYRFREAIGAFFEVPVALAAECLGGRREPLEVSHGLGVLAVSAFDFVQSEVGAYRELVLSVLTPPQVPRGGAWPRSAFFPFLIGTSSEASRHHGMTRWHLPHYPRDIALTFEVQANRLSMHAHERAQPIVALEVRGGPWSQAQQLYQLFSAAGGQLHQADVRMGGLVSEHEEETGRLVSHNHPMSTRLAAIDHASRPFREVWIRNGVQSIEDRQLPAIPRPRLPSP